MVRRAPEPSVTTTACGPVAASVGRADVGYRPPGHERDQGVVRSDGPEHLLEDRLRHLLAALRLWAVPAGDQLEGVAEPAQFMGGRAGESGAEDDVLRVVHRQRCSVPEQVREAQPAQVRHGAGVGGLGAWPGVVHAGSGFDDGAGDAAGGQVQGQEQPAGAATGDQDLHLRRRLSAGRLWKAFIRHGSAGKGRPPGWSACQASRSPLRRCRRAAAATAGCGRTPRLRGFRWR